MSKTKWSVDGPDGTILELDGRKFASDDDGAPMMCSLVCQNMGRHVHIDFCRADTVCEGSPEVQHIEGRLTPHPERAKDWITHSLYWRRSGLLHKLSLFECTHECLIPALGFKGQALHYRPSYFETIIK